jgi:hypothetical protein
MRQRRANLLLAEIGRHEVERFGEGHAAIVKPLALEALSRRVIDLEHLHASHERRLAEGKAVHPCSDDDVLTNAATHRGFQRILAVSRAKNRPSVAEVRAQRLIENRLPGTKLLDPGASSRVQPIEDNRRDGLALVLRDEAIAPGIIDQPRPVQAGMHRAHQ